MNAKGRKGGNRNGNIDLEKIKRLKTLLEEKPRSLAELRELFGFRTATHVEHLVYTATSHILIDEYKAGRGRNSCTMYALMERR